MTQNAGATLTLRVHLAGPPGTMTALGAIHVHGTLCPLRTEDLPAPLLIRILMRRFTDVPLSALVSFPLAKPLSTAILVHARRPRIASALRRTLCALAAGANAASMNIRTRRSLVTNPVRRALVVVRHARGGQTSVRLRRALRVTNFAFSTNISVCDARTRNTLKLTPTDITGRARAARAAKHTMLLSRTRASLGVG